MRKKQHPKRNPMPEADLSFIMTSGQLGLSSDKMKELATLMLATLTPEEEQVLRKRFGFAKSSKSHEG
jgi:hypothetical protein